MQIKARVEEARNPTKGLQASHAPLIAQERESLRQEIIDANKPLSKVIIVTDDEELLEVLQVGDSGVRMVQYASDLEEDSGEDDA